MTKVQKAEIKIRSLEAKLRIIRDEVDFKIKVVDNVINSYKDMKKKHEDDKLSYAYVTNTTAQSMAEIEKESLKELYSKFDEPYTEISDL